MRSQPLIGLLLSIILYLLFAPPKIYASITIDHVSPTIVTSSDDIITLSVSASGLDNKTQYLQTGITKESKANYFGYTKNNTGEWKKYESSPSDYTSFYNFTPSSGSWSGQVLAKIDTSDSGYAGSGSYTIKLLKYITSSSSHQDSNAVAFNINLTSSPLPSPQPSPSPSPSTTDTSNKPTIVFYPPSKLPVGTTLSIPIQASNLPVTSYYIKVRIGPDSSNLAQGQTYSNDKWLSDKDRWTEFSSTSPKASGSWQGNINARLPSGRSAGSYKIRIKFAKTTDTSDYFESDIKDIQFQPETVTTTSTANKISPTGSTSLSKSTAPTTSGITATDQNSDPNLILGLSTSSAHHVSSAANIKSKEQKPPLDLRIKHDKLEITPSNLIIPTGLFLLGLGGVYFLRIRKTGGQKDIIKGQI